MEMLHAARNLHDGSPGPRKGGVHMLLVLRLDAGDVARHRFDLGREVGQLTAELEGISPHLRGRAG